MSRNEWSYWRYLREVAVGMTTSWARAPWYWRELVEGVKALIYVIGLLILPLLVPFAPLFALLVRASDRRDVRELEKARSAARARVHQWGKV
ncbi:hypothetical protein [Cupriavidus sp. DL-D2]|uniref:hypothetical protein n=1 Tax=Cupriavidus sp. DL-D2 TaxID=3144974 RepID=UPI003215BDBF